MREILFRGKREDGAGWAYGHYHNTDYVGYPNGGDNKITRHYILPQNAGDAHVVIPETVGQFTGLTDKNGKKIFEGDIVRDISAYTAHLTMFERGKETKEDVERYRYSGNVSVVAFETEDHGSCGCCFHMFSGSGFEAKDVDIRCCEVIGNIHDNPELLEGAVKNESC